MKFHILLLFPFLAACNTSAQQPPVANEAVVQQQAVQSEATGFAVVELFTSEGCSSCPPADQALAQLQQQYAGRPVHLLAYHVDYWNYLGWADPFSAAAYSQRQQWYGGLMNLESIYTPQAIVNGQWQTTGSRRTAIAEQIEAALTAPAEDSVQIRVAETDNNRLAVHYQLPAGNTKNIVLALVQKRAVTKVPRGENGGRSLQHVNVVRDYATISHPATAGKQLLELPEGLTRSGCFVVAFLQDDKGVITGAVSVE